MSKQIDYFDTIMRIHPNYINNPWKSGDFKYYNNHASRAQSTIGHDWTGENMTSIRNIGLNMATLIDNKITTGGKR